MEKCPNCGSENINKTDGCLECPFPYVVGIVSIPIDGTVFCHGYFNRESELGEVWLEDSDQNKIYLNKDPANYLIGSEIIDKLIVKKAEIFLKNVKELCEGKCEHKWERTEDVGYSKCSICGALGLDVSKWTKEEIKNGKD